MKSLSKLNAKLNSWKRRQALAARRVSEINKKISRILKVRR